MGSKYDVVVIGAGLGGLSSATFLAKNGYRVLLLEKHNIPGGYATSFVRGRFEFEVALHELSDMGTSARPGVLRKFLKYIGVLDKVEFVQIPELYRSVFPGVDLTLPMGKSAYVDTLCQAFPHESKGIRRFFERVFKLSREANMVTAAQQAKLPDDLPSLAALPFKLRAIPRYMFATWGDVLARDIKDERVRAVISQYWGYFGLAPSKLSFFYMALGLATYITHGAAHVRGGSQALSNAFISRFEELGGEVRFSCGVRSIVSENGQAKAVILDTDEKIEADVVVSNADPITVCRDLMEEGSVPTSYFKKLQSNEIAAGSFNVYVGAAKPIEYFGIKDHEIFINEDFDLENHYRKFGQLEKPGVVCTTCYNVTMPDFSPPGTSVFVLTALAYGKPWYGVDPKEYVDTKNGIADQMIEMSEQIIPGLRENTEAVSVSTPLTNMRYANTMGGSIYGFNNTPFNHTVLRLPYKGPLDNLYFVGAWVQPGGGFSPAMLSGQLSGMFITRKLAALKRKSA